MRLRNRLFYALLTVAALAVAVISLPHPKRY
jgi:hypothetical protein